jgi:hypothetical protein
VEVNAPPIEDAVMNAAKTGEPPSERLLQRREDPVEQRGSSEPMPELQASSFFAVISEPLYRESVRFQGVCRPIENLMGAPLITDISDFKRRDFTFEGKIKPVLITGEIGPAVVL